MTFGENLKLIRTVNYHPAMTQTEVEKAGSLPAGIVSQYEIDAREPSLENLRKLKSGLGCTWHELLDF